MLALRDSSAERGNGFGLYAIDLGTEMEAKPDRGSGRVALLKLSKGVLESRAKLREGKTYRISNRAEEERFILVEHPVRPEFQLVSKDKPTERTRDVYRFAIKVPAGKSAALEVVEERRVVETAQLTNADDEAIRVGGTDAGPRGRNQFRPRQDNLLHGAETAPLDSITLIANIFRARRRPEQPFFGMHAVGSTLRDHVSRCHRARHTHHTVEDIFGHQPVQR